MPILTISVTACERCRELDGPKALAALSSYAACLLKETFVVFNVEQNLRKSQRSRSHFRTRRLSEIVKTSFFRSMKIFKRKTKIE